MTAVYFLVASVWLVASLARQVGFADSWLSTRDHFRLVPNWAFFAPRAGERDQMLLVRRSVNGNVSDWSVLYESQPQAPYSLLWNPGTVGNKALADLDAVLTRALHELRRVSRPMIGIRVSSPYIAMITYVIEQTWSSSCDWIQCALVNVDGYAPLAKTGPQLVLLSGKHRP